jgi:hypothetical protein
MQFYSCGFVYRSVNCGSVSQVAQTAGTAICRLQLSFSLRGWFQRWRLWSEEVFVGSVWCVVFPSVLVYCGPYEIGTEALQEATSESHDFVLL